MVKRHIIFDKADWYDPTIKRKDEFLGIRKHSQDSGQKNLKNHIPYGIGTNSTFWPRLPQSTSFGVS